MLTLIPCPFHPVLLQWHVKDSAILLKVQVEGYTWLSHCGLILAQNVELHGVRELLKNFTSKKLTHTHTQKSLGRE